MLKYLLIKETGKEVVYKYYPENESESGVVSISKDTGECSIDELSPNDRHQRYAMKMFMKLEEFISKGTFDKEGIVAWM